VFYIYNINTQTYYNASSARNLLNNIEQHRQDYGHLTRASYMYVDLPLTHSDNHRVGYS